MLKKLISTFDGFYNYYITIQWKIFMKNKLQMLLKKNEVKFNQFSLQSIKSLK